MQGCVSVSCLHSLRNEGELGTVWIGLRLGIAQISSGAKQETICVKGTMYIWEG